MQDGYAKLAVGVDVWVVEGMGKLELGRGIGVVGGKFHGGEEVAAVVEGVWVDDYEGDLPVEDVFFFELRGGGFSLLVAVGIGEERWCCWLPTSTLTHFSCDRALNSFIRIRSAMVGDRIAFFEEGKRGQDSNPGISILNAESERLGCGR